MENKQQEYKSRPGPTQPLHPLIQDPNDRSILSCINTLNRTTSFLEFIEQMIFANGELTENSANGLFWTQRTVKVAVAHVSKLLLSGGLESPPGQPSPRQDEHLKSALTLEPSRLLDTLNCVEELAGDELEALAEANYFFFRAIEAIFDSYETRMSIDWELANSGLSQWQEWLRERESRVRRLVDTELENAKDNAKGNAKKYNAKKEEPVI